MDLFKWDTLTDGAIGAGIGIVVGVGVIGATALLTGGLALVPALVAVGVGTVLGAIHGAGDEGGECREVIAIITKKTAVYGGIALVGYFTWWALGGDFESMLWPVFLLVWSQG